MRLSLTRADQNGMRSASIFAVVVCIQLLELIAGSSCKPNLLPRLEGFLNTNAQTAKK